MGISGGLCALSHYDARTRLVSLPNTGAGPDSERGLQHTIPIQRERERSSVTISSRLVLRLARALAAPAFPLHFVSVCGGLRPPLYGLCTGPDPLRAPHRLYTAHTVLRSAHSHSGRSFLALDCVFLMSGLCEELWTNERPGDVEGVTIRPSHICRCLGQW